MAGPPDIWPPSLDREELSDFGTENPVAFEFVNPLLTDDALDLVRAAVEGNGLDPDLVAFRGFAGETMPFTATMVFRATPETARKVVAGKKAGEAVASETMAREKIDLAVKTLCVAPATRDFVVKKLRQRHNSGFAEDGFSLLLDETAAQFAIPEECTTCGGQGKAPCGTCHGAGGVACPRCHAKGAVTCPACRGAHTVTKHGKKQPCAACHTQGRIRCPGCKGGGRAPCRACQGQGRKTCLACQGTGWRTIMLSTRVRLKGRFVQDDRLPGEVLLRFREMGAGLIFNRHAEIAVRDAAPETEIKDDEAAVAFDGRIPYGAMFFTLGEREEQGLLFGFNPLLLETSFLETLAAPGLDALSRAATPGSAGSTLLHDAAAYRVVADGLQAARLPSRRAMRQLEENYPVGLSEAAMRNLLRTARMALKRTGRVGLMAGFAIGSLVTLGGAYGLSVLPRSAFQKFAVPAALHLPQVPFAVLGTIPVCVLGTFVIAALAHEGENLMLRHALRGLTLGGMLGGTRRIAPRLDRLTALSLVSSVVAWLIALGLGGHALY